MTEEFGEEIRKIAERSKASTDDVANSFPRSETRGGSYIDAVGEFFDAARDAVDIYNETLGRTGLSVYRLKPEFFDVFLGIPGRRDGFTIVSPRRIVILFDEEPSTLTVIGRKRKSDGGGAVFSPSLQLIKVTFDRSSGGMIYSDNTGGRVDPYGLTPLFVRWVSSE